MTRAVPADHVLLLLAQACKQRHDLHAGRVMAAQVVGSLADLALAWQEDQHVACTFAPQFIDRIADGIVEAVFAALFEWAVALPCASGMRPIRGIEPASSRIRLL